MRINKLLIIGLFLIIGSFGVLSAYDTSTNPYNFNYCWNFNQGSGTATELCSGGIYNGTLNAPTEWNTTGKFDGAVSFDTTGTITYGQVKPALAQDQNVTLSLWYKQDSTNTYRYLYELGNNGGDAVQLAMYLRGDNNRIEILYFQSSNGATSDIWQSTANTTTDLTQYHHYYVFWVAGRRQITVRLDGVDIDGSWIGGGEGTPYGSLTQQRSGAYAGSQGFRGDLDDLLVGFNLTNFTDTQINNLYLSNFTSFNLSYTNILPANNSASSQFSFTPGLFNLSATSDRAFNVSFYINGTLQSTINITTAGTYQINFSKVLDTLNNSQGTFNFFLINNQTNVTTPNITFYVDREAPIIKQNTFINNSFYLASGGNITGQFNISDTFLLFSYNISIDGVNVDSKDNLNTQNYSINLSRNISTLNAGLHTLTLRYADGHTDNNIPNYDVSRGVFGNRLRFQTPRNKDITIAPTNPSVFDTLNAQKRFDRYTFTYEPSNRRQTSYTFYVDSNDDLNIIRTNSKYKNYIITGEHWVDFVLDDQPQSRVEIELINPRRALVTVSNLNPADSFQFSSIGDLNIVSVNYTFGVFKTTTTYNDPVTETQEHTTTLYVNFTGTGLTDNNFSSLLQYNNTLSNITALTDGLTYVTYSSTLNAPNITANSQLVPFNWSLYANSSTPNYILFNHTVNKIQIGDCALNPSWYPAINLYSKDEEKNDTDFYVADTTIHIQNQVWVADEGSYRNFSMDFTGKTNYSICLTPNSSSYTINSIMEYFAPNYANRKYYFDNLVINNVTQNVSLYNLNSSKASDIVLTVTDKNTGRAVANAFIKVLRFYPENNSYRTVEIAKSDDNGNSLAKMVLADPFYKFIVETDRTVRLNTNVQRILALTKSLQITQTEDILESWRNIDNVQTSVSCDNSTASCRFIWSDTTNLVQTATLQVYELTGGNRRLLSSQSVTSTAGTIVYNIPGTTTGRYFEARGLIHTTTANSMYDQAVAYMDFREKMEEKFGRSSLFPFFILILAMGAAFLDVSPVMVLIGSMMAFIGGAMLGFLPVNLGFVISLIITMIILIVKMRA